MEVNKFFDFTGSIQPERGVLPKQIQSEWQLSDYIGQAKVRLGFGRNNYRIEPGLYFAGKPDKKNNVFVTANYKLSFDKLRINLSGLNAWILVLDTKGINVWCAAGKGTFGTRELIYRIEQCRLKDRVDHKQIIVPQLGAPGIAAYEVKNATGFNVNSFYTS